jgi:hypothetical protein
MRRINESLLTIGPRGDAVNAENHRAIRDGQTGLGDELTKIAVERMDEEETYRVRSN